METTMRWSGILLLALFVGAVASAGLFIRRTHAQVAGMTVVQNVTMESYKNGGKVLTNKRLNAISGRGLALLERIPGDAFAKTPGFHYRKLHMADGREIDVRDPVKTKTTYYYPKPSYSWNPQAQQESQCAGRQDRVDGAETILGVHVVKVTRVASDAGYTRWLAPGYGCIEVQKIVLWKEPGTGALTGKTTYIPESVELGEPDQTIFDIPSDYVERSPDQAQLAVLELMYGGKEGAAQAIARGACVRPGKHPVYERFKTPSSLPLMARLRLKLGLR
jgi:hypothetical protein